MILVDTNILLRSMHTQHPHHVMSNNALAALRLRNEALCVAPQNLVELWAVATRPRTENGLGLTIAQAGKELADVQNLFWLLPYTFAVTELWRQIVLEQGIIGKQTHDAHLVAIMQANAVSSVLTFDTGHFVRFPGITVLDPSKV